ncbi:MAG: aminotransferase class V-fold PLP-dependent enzyme [Actinomycetota bacterium]|nr:aminotransferase class V-fold PLP-dependent enzyme [Actinomycetota bacterium]
MGGLRDRAGEIDLAPTEFRRLGHELVDELSDFLESLPTRPVTPGESPREVRAALGEGPLPERGAPAEELLRETADLLFQHSLLNGHPRFWGYIVGAPAPIGALADLLAATVNPNVGGFVLAPMATEIEAQTVRWLAELVGFPSDCGGLLVSGGNMANFVAFLAARRAGADWNVREDGAGRRRLRVYVSRETHTWIEKAADLFGLGTGAIRWIATDARQRMDLTELRRQIAADRVAGDTPLVVVGAGGTVSTGAVDPLDEIARVCRAEGMWFHVDGAYGAVAAATPDAPPELKALSEADSVALDPHKWLYAPVEAGCALVRSREALLDAFSYRPPYYHLAREQEDEPINYFEYGPQNSRGFRALKVWLALRQVGREGYVRMIGDDIRLARELHDIVQAEPELEPGTTSLSITTFRYVPEGAAGDDEYLNELNAELLTRLEGGGEAFVSNAVVDGRFYLRACIVNFRTTLEDVRALPAIVKRLGAEAHSELRARVPG